MTGDQAQDLANRIRADLSQQERLGTFQLIPDLTLLDPRNLLRLQGSNSSWDQTYLHRQRDALDELRQTSR